MPALEHRGELHNLLFVDAKIINDISAIRVKRSTMVFESAPGPDIAKVVVRKLEDGARMYVPGSVSSKNEFAVTPQPPSKNQTWIASWTLVTGSWDPICLQDHAVDADCVMLPLFVAARRQDGPGSCQTTYACRRTTRLAVKMDNNLCASVRTCHVQGFEKQEAKFPFSSETIFNDEEKRND